MYGKLFESTFTGSMYGRGAVVFAVWSYAIAHGKPDGSVEINPRMLAATLGESLELVQSALQFLQATDPESRTKTEDGKRLIRESEYLYRIVNFQQYRNIRNDEERREYNRRKQAEHRAKLKASSHPSLTVIEKSALSAHSYSYSDSDTESGKRKKAPPPRKRCPADFQITQELRAWAATNAPDVNLERETESFRDWEFRTGRRDWPATWRTWMRKAQEAPRPTINGKHQPPPKPITQRIRDAQLSVPAHRKQDADYIAALVGVSADQVRAELML